MCVKAIKLYEINCAFKVQYSVSALRREISRQ